MDNHNDVRRTLGWLALLTGATVLMFVAAVPGAQTAKAGWDSCEVWGTCSSQYWRRKEQRQIERQREARREREIHDWRRCREWGRGDCGERPYSHERVHHHHAGTHLEQCKPMVTARGGAANTEMGALNQAKRQLRLTIRSDIGEVYQDLAFGKDVTYRCWRASTNESVLGQMAERGASSFGFEGYQKRCQIWMRPCIPPRIPLAIDREKEDRD